MQRDTDVPPDPSQSHAPPKRKSKEISLDEAGRIIAAAPPTDHELYLLRSQIDPERLLKAYRLTVG